MSAGVAISIPESPPVEIRRAAARALRAGATHYTERAGIEALRVAVAIRLTGGRVDAGRVILTAGAAEGLFLVVGALTVVGDAVATSDPWVAAVARSLDREPIGLESPETAALVVVGDPAQAREVRHRQAVVVVLEAAGEQRPSAAADPDLDGSIVVGDLSAAGLSAWSAGYLVAPAEAIGALLELKQGLNICSPAFAQHAASAAVAQMFAAPRPGVRAASAPEAGSVRTPRRLPAPIADEGTRQRYDLLDLLARTPGAISLGRGDPDLPTPAPIVEAAIAAMDEPRAGDPLGLPALRAAIAGKLAADNGVVADPESEVLVTSGGQEAIFLVLSALLTPGDEVLMPSPRYTAYDVAISMTGARIVSVPPRGPRDFGLDVDALAARITPRTRALLVITPGNPTAAVATRRELEAVAALARAHGLTVISDEMYERIVYDGAEHVSLGSLPGMREQTVTVGGFSKAYAMTGWRVGYLAAPASIVSAASRRKALWSGPVATVAQHAALAALSGGPELWREGLTIYSARRSLTVQALADMEVRHAPSQGAFYVLVDVSELGRPAYEISRAMLRDVGVFVYPGSGFGAEWSGHLRLAWLAPEKRLLTALERMATWIGDHR